MGIFDIIKGILAALSGARQNPPPPVTDVSVQPELPPPANKIDADAPPKGLEPLLPPVPPKTKFEDRLRDRRDHASSKHVFGKRDWSKVTGICLHQTACNLGEKPARWDTVGCHVGVTRTGQVVWLHDFDKLVVHGNGWNAQTVGIEIDGLYAGIEGDPKTVWNDPSTPQVEKGQVLTPETVEAVQQLIRFICSEVERNGGKVKALVAHRQASKDRRNDPGSAIWQKVALPMSKELGLHDGGPGFKIGTGYPIPEAWDPTRKGQKY